MALPHAVRRWKVRPSKSCPDVAGTIRRAARRYRAAALTMPAGGLATWAVLSWLVGHPLLPSWDVLSLTGLACAALVVAISFEELSAIARHREADAAAAASLRWPNTLSITRGSDAVVDTPTGPIAVTVLGLAPRSVTGRSDLTRAVRCRRGVSTRRTTRSAARGAGAPTLVLPLWADLDLVVDGVHIVGATQWSELLRPARPHQQNPDEGPALGPETRTEVEHT